jgi:hypothetical protein
LREAGFRSADISALLPSTESTKEFSHELSNKTPEGTASGAISGAALGGALGFLAGVGTIALPGFGALVAAGPIMATLAGMGSGGAIGGLVGGLVGMGMPEYEAKRYESRVKKGGHLLSVHCDDRDWQNRARDLLERAGGLDITATSEEAGDVQNKDKPRPLVGNY